MQQALVSGEDPLPGFQTAIFFLCPHMAERERGPAAGVGGERDRQRDTERERFGVSSPFIRTPPDLSEDQGYLYDLILP